MLKDRWIYFKDQWIAWEQATVHVASHSFARGSAIFEVLSLHALPGGPVIFRLDEHVRRLFKSAEFLAMKIPASPDAVSDKVRETVRKNGLRKGVIKILCHYPQIALDILPPPDDPSMVIFALDPESDLPGFQAPGAEETTACISTWRKLDPQTVPVEAKASANYLNGMMARLEAARRGFGQAILLDTQGFVAEGGTESVFMVKGNTLMTPARGTILQSITRKSILELAAVEGIEAKEIRISPRQLLEADEAFLSCTPFKVLPLERIEDRRLPRVPGPVTQALSSSMQGIVEGEDRRFEKWLFPVE